MDTGLRVRRHCFELGGGAIAEGRMPADSVIEYFDPFENVLPGFFASPIALMMHVFRFERVEETSTTALSQQFPRRLMLAVRP